MKSMIVVALALVAIAAAHPVDEKKPPAEITNYKFNQDPEGRYEYGFESDDGIQRQETGEVKEVQNEKNEPQKVVVVRGEYSYVDDGGNQVTITYVADENGFRAEGPSIPQVPARR